MALAILIGVLPVLAIALAGAILALSPARSERPRLWLRHPALVAGGQRLARAREALVAELTSLGAYVVIVAAGTAIIGAMMWPLGWIAFQSGPIDLAMFEWLQARQVPGWTQAMDVITRMGNMTPTKVYVLAGSVAFALAVRHRRWVPPVVIVTVFCLEHYLQLTLSATVDRGHPPTSLGTWPSGGCARIICVFGLLLYLYFRCRQPGRRTVIAGWSLIAVLAYIEGYTRAYTLRHWVTDVLGGWLFGVLLLLLMIAATEALDRPWRVSARQHQRS